MKSDLFPGLADIVFAERDPTVIEATIINGYEQAANRTLAKGDPIRLFLEAVAFVLIQLRHLLDHTGKMNLLAYAVDDYLDHIGAMLAVYRLPAQAALTTLKFILSETQPGTVIIPAGTRATPGGGDIVFATTEAAEIPMGAKAVEIPARCLVEGSAGNGFLQGQIRKIVDPFPWQMSVENTTISSGGTDLENDENLRERIQIAPEYFSVAGPHGAYKYWARTAHQGIVDVAIVGPPEIEPGNVEIYPLMAGGGLPSQEILDAVYEICNAEDIRPLTDYVHVLKPKTVEYRLEVKYWLDRAQSSQASALQSAVEQAAHDFTAWQKVKLGRDLNPSELIHRMVEAGAKRVEVISPSFRVLSAAEVAIPSFESVTFGGFEDA